MKPVIVPEVISILNSTRTSIERSSTNIHVQPQAEPKRSFWGKLRGFFNRISSVVKKTLTLVTIAISALNAVSRFKYASNSRTIVESVC